MKLSEAAKPSEAATIPPFCTCAERPASVRPADPATYAGAADRAHQSRPYCTCQHSQMQDDQAAADVASGDAVLEVTDDEVDGATEPIPDDVGATRPPTRADAAEVTSQPRPYCTCQVPLMLDDDAVVDALSDVTDDEVDGAYEPIPDGTDPDQPPTFATPADTARQPRPYCTCQIPQTIEEASVKGALADVTDDVDVGASDPIPVDADPTQPPTDATWADLARDPRPYCTCQIPQPQDDDAETAETQSETVSDETEDDEVASASESGATEPITVEPMPQVGADDAEHDLAHLDTLDGEIMLTDRRVVMHGNTESHTIFASMSLDHVTGARIDRTRRGIRGWVWTAIGIAATILIWQILDGGGWIRLAFPGLIGLSTVVLFFAHLLSPLPLIFSVVGSSGDKIEARISNDQLDNADTFGGKVILEAQAAAARVNRTRHMHRSADSQ